MTLADTYRLVDHNVRVATPDALDACGQYHWAMRLRNLPPLRTEGDLFRAARLIDRAQQALRENQQ